MTSKLNTYLYTPSRVKNDDIIIIIPHVMWLRYFEGLFSHFSFRENLICNITIYSIKYL